jgi:Lar family restriction alleviation protein
MENVSLLLPCPFCGGNVVGMANVGGLWEVTCGTWSPGSGCGARSGNASSEGEARERWNSRAQDREEVAT